MKIENVKRMNIDELNLDNQNPRLNIVKKDFKGEVQDKLIHVVGEQKIIALMEDIINTSSINTINNFGIIERNVVVDGNRRTLALRLIRGTIKTKFKEINKFLKESNLDEFKKWDGFVNVTIFRNREEANRYIKMIHTNSEDGVHTLPWDTISRKIFEGDKEAEFIKYIIEEYYKMDVVSFFKKENSNGNPIKYTGWQKLFNSSVTKSIMGYEIKKDGFKIEDKSNKETIKKFHDLIDFAFKKSLSSQSVFTKSDTSSFLDEFMKGVDVDQSKKMKEAAKKLIKQSKKKTPKKEKVDFYNISLNNDIFDNINILIKEIKRAIKDSYKQYQKMLTNSLRPLFEEVLMISIDNGILTDKMIRKDHGLDKEAKIDYGRKMFSLIKEISKTGPLNKKDFRWLKDRVAYKETEAKPILLMSSLSEYIHNMDNRISNNEFKDYYKIFKILILEVENSILFKN